MFSKKSQALGESINNALHFLLLWRLSLHLSNMTTDKPWELHYGKLFYAHQTSQNKLVSSLVIQIISSKGLQDSTTMLQLKFYIIYVVQKLIGHPKQECPINFALFLFPFVCNARSPDHQLFLIFSHEVLHHKGRKVTRPNFEKKFWWTWLGGLKSP